MSPRKSSVKALRKNDKERKALEIARAKRKRLGKYYTPDGIASALTKWAIRSGSDRVLDPSYGGCAFVEAALRELKERGCRQPRASVFGVDIDPEAMLHVTALYGRHFREANFLSCDFLTTSPAAFGRKMTAVIGNPPYVRHHQLTKQLLESARHSLQPTGRSVDGKSGYWVYFAIHALSFLERGGRLALVLPVSVLNSGYAEAVRAALKEGFKTVRMALIQEQVFAGASEGNLLVLADGWDHGPAQTSLAILRSSGQVPAWCQSSAPDAPGTGASFAPGSWKEIALTPESIAAFNRTASLSRVVRLGDVANVRIGTVTGGNRFFLLSKNEVLRADLPQSQLSWIVDSARRLRTLELTKPDLLAALETGARVRLLSPAPGRTPKKLQEYLRTPDALRASKTGHSKKRSPWFRLTDTAIPDAFLGYVTNRAPRLTLNAAQVTCTNAVHRIWWLPSAGVIPNMAALSFLTSLSGLSAEMNGRSYGGGALKLEIRDAKSLHLPLPAVPATKIQEAFDSANRLVRNGKWEQARELADQVVLHEGLGISQTDIGHLRAAQDRLYALRTGTELVEPCVQLSPQRSEADTESSGSTSGAHKTARSVFARSVTPTGA